MYYWVNVFVAALCDRLLDFDEKVRKQVVAVICEVACHALSSIPPETVKLVAERLRDKSVNILLLFHLLLFSSESGFTHLLMAIHIIFPPPYLQFLVKKYTLERLAEIYRVYCMKSADGSIKSQEYDWIPGKILRCFYDKDFR